jgi:hypothetical protein
MRRARHDPANDYFFSKMGPASWRQYLVSCVIVVILLSMGLALWIGGDNPVLALVALLVALVALIYQFHQVRRYWMQSLVPDPGESG